jgi:hypothetical protein
MGDLLEPCSDKLELKSQQGVSLLFLQNIVVPGQVSSRLFFELENSQNLVVKQQTLIGKTFMTSLLDHQV